MEIYSNHHNFQTVRAKDLKFWQNVHHPLCVMWKSVGASRSRVCYQRGLPRLVPQRITDLINYGGVCRTGPATPGLLITWWPVTINFFQVALFPQTVDDFLPEHLEYFLNSQDVSKKFISLNTCHSQFTTVPKSKIFGPKLVCDIKKSWRKVDNLFHFFHEKCRSKTLGFFWDVCLSHKTFTLAFE